MCFLAQSPALRQSGGTWVLITAHLLARFPPVLINSSSLYQPPIASRSPTALPAYFCPSPDIGIQSHRRFGSFSFSILKLRFSSDPGKAPAPPARVSNRPRQLHPSPAVSRLPDPNSYSNSVAVGVAHRWPFRCPPSPGSRPSDRVVCEYENPQWPRVFGLSSGDIISASADRGRVNHRRVTSKRPTAIDRVYTYSILHTCHHHAHPLQRRT
jgi:hypothetical protein